MNLIETVIVYLLNIQWLFWMTLYDKEVDINWEGLETPFYVTGLFAVLMTLVWGLGVGPYKPYHLVLYILMTLFSVYFFNTGPRNRDFKQSLCLGFLTVFINSFYWELPIHLSAYLMFGLNATRDIIQLLIHIVPIVWVVREFEFKETRKWYMVQLLGGYLAVNVYVFSTWFFDYLGFYSYTPWVNMVAHGVLRLVCLLILNRIIYRAEKR